MTDEGAISPKSLPPGGKVPPKGADEGAMIERFFVGPDALIGPLDGSFRRGVSPPAGRVSFPAMGKKPMAQATLSCPFGAIHLEDRRGRGQWTTAPLTLRLGP